MKAVAIFLVSVALLSAADSAPSAENGKTGAVQVSNMSNSEKSAVSSPIVTDQKLVPEDQKKTEASSTHEATVSKQVDFTPPPQHSTESSVSPSSSQPFGASGPENKTTTTAPQPTNSTTPVPTTSTTSSTSTSTTTPTTPTPKSTTSSPTTSQPPSSTLPPTTAKPVPTPAPKPAERHFDGPSFIGGAVLVLGLGAICGVLYMFYKARTDQNYRTLSEEPSVI